MTILHIDSSINGDASNSRKISAAVVEALRAADPTAQIVTRDLAAAPLGHLTLESWGTEEGQDVLAEFLSADTVVIGAGFYNFTIPSQLKSWIDRIVVAGKTFAYVDGRPAGLVSGKRVIIAVARGGVYSGDSPFAAFEHGESLLRGIFGFLGVTDLEIIVAEGLRMGPEIAEPALQGALAKARDAAGTRVTA